MEQACHRYGQFSFQINATRRGARASRHSVQARKQCERPLTSSSHMICRGLG
eukprot:CAMPEP_0182563696 /NCGR_PEP_ID=MMETSP1324-20130603/5786_1 /TAXON_ID=236786 /ORGANISM="Florenciella sp., Strain RCC1587" /LENGTH=51 /DNA_ID=CAMNT_0024776957 /DNA_START=184 /DNA_END=335 /DNA_ORIENTATION=-